MSGQFTRRLCGVLSVPEQNAWIFVYAQSFMVVDQHTGKAKEYELETSLAEHVDRTCVNLTRDHVNHHWEGYA